MHSERKKKKKKIKLNNTNCEAARKEISKATINCKVITQVWKGMINKIVN